MMSEDFKMQIGEKAPDFNLPATNGRMYSRFSFQKQLMVLVFTCNHCPYAKAYEKRLIDLAKTFSANCDFAAINSNDASKYPDDNFEKMKERAKEKNFPFPYLHDESQEVAMEFGALVTPHILVFDKEKKLAYQGGIDNSFRSGDYNSEEKPTANYLFDALSELISGKSVKKKISPVVGCSIKWK